MYRGKGATISDAAKQQLEDAGFQVDDRGAYLGISSQVPFAAADNGCQIDTVREKSPAEKAGLQPDDVIVKYGDKPVKDFTELIDLLKAAEPGQKVLFTIHRAGQPMTLTVELGSW